MNARTPLTKKLRLLIAAHIGEPWGGISSNYENLLDSNLSEQVEFYFVETSAGQSFEKAGYFGVGNIMRAFRMILRYWVALIQYEPDVIHIGSAHLGSFLKHSVMILLGRLHRKKVLVMLHCGYRALLPETGIWRQYVLFILRCCDGIAVISQEWLYLKNLLPNAYIQYIPNALNLKPYLALPLSRFQARSAVRILYLGHIGAEKGSFDLIEAANIICRSAQAPFRIDLFGDTLSTGEFEQAQAVIEQNGLQNHVFLCKPVFGKQKIECLEQADIYVLPSYSEGMPISIIEALASALPIVATSVGGIPDMIDSGWNGILVSPRTPSDLARALLQLIDNRILRQQFAYAARQVARERFDIETRVGRLVEMYSTLTRGRQNERFIRHS